MYRLAYRNFGTHESLVVTHSVAVTPTRAAVRWYEVRDPKGTPVTHVAPLMPSATQAQIRGRCAQMGFSGQKAETRVSNRFTRWRSF